MHAPQVLSGTAQDASAAPQAPISTIIPNNASNVLLVPCIMPPRVPVLVPRLLPMLVLLVLFGMDPGVLPVLLGLPTMLQGSCAFLPLLQVLAQDLLQDQAHQPPQPPIPQPPQVKAVAKLAKSGTAKDASPATYPTTSTMTQIAARAAPPAKTMMSPRKNV